MADSDWISVQSRREQKFKRDNELRESRLRAEAPLRPSRTQDLEWFKSTHAPPICTSEEYARNHARIWGVEEDMVDDKHRSGKAAYPEGSARDIAHATYSESTSQMNKTASSYRNALKHHVKDNKELTKEEREYYNRTSANLLPIQHADLSGRALDRADAAQK